MKSNTLKLVTFCLRLPLKAVVSTAIGEIPEEDPYFHQSRFAEMWKMFDEIDDPSEKECFTRRVRTLYKEMAESLEEAAKDKRRAM
jgi:hypothetical protein